MLVMPIFGDQAQNGKFIEDNGLGLAIFDKNNLNSEDLYSKIRKLLAPNNRFPWSLKIGTFLI